MRVDNISSRGHGGDYHVNLLFIGLVRRHDHKYYNVTGRCNNIVYKHYRCETKLTSKIEHKITRSSTPIKFLSELCTVQYIRLSLMSLPYVRLVNNQFSYIEIT